jgi:succinate-acetate transporter protein
MHSKSRAAITTTIGFMCLALTDWMLSMSNAAWFPRIYGHGTAMFYPLGIVLGVMGILAFIEERGLDAIIFFGGAGLFWSTHVYLSTTNGVTAMEPGSYAGWFLFVWAVFFCYVWFGSFKSGIIRFLFLLGTWLTLLALAIGNWGDGHRFGHGLLVLGGYIGLATAILAAIASAWSVIGHGMKSDDRSRDSLLHKENA